MKCVVDENKLNGLSNVCLFCSASPFALVVAFHWVSVWPHTMKWYEKLAHCDLVIPNFFNAQQTVRLNIFTLFMYFPSHSLPHSLTSGRDNFKWTVYIYVGRGRERTTLLSIKIALLSTKFCFLLTWFLLTFCKFSTLSLLLLLLMAASGDKFSC